MKKVIDLLADPDCEVICPIIVDYNLIEVNERTLQLTDLLTESAERSQNNEETTQVDY